MWTIPKTLNPGTIETSLNLFDLSTINANVPLFRRNIGKSTIIRDPKDEIIDSTRPDIIQDNTVLTPIYTGFLHQIEGVWESDTLLKVNTINKLQENSYIQIENVTYSISDFTTRTYTGFIEIEVVDENNFGFFDRDVTKVVSRGLTLDFTQVDGEVLILTTSKSCRAKAGDIAQVYFTLDYPELSFNSKIVNIFSTENTNISLVTYFIYQNINYYLANTLESGTLINISNSRFLTIQ